MKKIFIFLCILFTFVIIPNKTLAAPPIPSVNVYNLSNTGYSDKWSTIYEDSVYWLDAYQSVIYGYNLIEQRKFTLIDNQLLPSDLFAIIAYDGRYLVYNSYDNVSYNVNVYDTDTNNIIVVTEGVGSRWATDYESKIIIYRDGGACGKLYAYHILTGERKLITEQVCGEASISQRFIVWGYSVPNGSGIFGYDLKTDSKYDIATQPGYRSSPDIHKDKIIWSINNATNADVYIYDLKTKQEQLVYTSPNYWISWPSISNRYAVWGKNTAQHISGVEGIDLRTGQVFEIQEQGQHQNDNMSAFVEGNIVAWMAWRTGNGDIYGASINR